MSCARKPIPFDGLVQCEAGSLYFNSEMFLEIYDEFSKLTQAKVKLVGNTAIALLRVNVFGVFWQQAVALLTAHRIATTYNIGNGYEDAGKNELSNTTIATSISASTSSLSESSSLLSLNNSEDPFTSDLSRTAYGLELLGLIKNIIPAGEIVRGGSIPYNCGESGQWPSGAGY